MLYFVYIFLKKKRICTFKTVVVNIEFYMYLKLINTVFKYFKETGEAIF